MEIRFVSEQDKERIKKIESYCFINPMDDAQFFIENVLKLENCLGCFDGQHLGAILHIIPFEMLFYGNNVSMGGVASVATLPEYRHRNCASRLLVKSLEIMKQRGYIFSILGPFSYPFYRKYGWELAFCSRGYKLNIMDFKGFGKGKGEFVPLILRDIPRINLVYQDFAAKYNGPICRGQDHWELIFKRQDRDRHYRYGYEDGSGDLEGYIFYYLRDGNFYVRELVYNSLEGKLELFRFIYYHSAQATQVIWQAPADDTTLFMLDNPQGEHSTIPGMMLRVVDVKRALELYPFPMAYSGSFTIKIQDPWAVWNNQVFRVTNGDGRAEVEETDKTPVDITCSIQTFSQLISGCIGMKEAVEMGKVKGENLRFLEEAYTLFPPHVTWIADNF